MGFSLVSATEPAFEDCHCSEPLSLVQGEGDAHWWSEVAEHMQRPRGRRVPPRVVQRRPEVSGTPAERSSRSGAGREDSAGEGGQLR